MTPEQALQILEEKFTSGNDIEVERTTITREEFEALKHEVKRLRNRLVAFTDDFH